jgi:site-specific recombinase XerD
MVRSQKEIAQNRTSVNDFHQVKPNQTERYIVQALEHGSITPEDAVLIRAFVTELESTHDIGNLRAIKIVSTLANWRKFIKPFNSLTMVDVYAAIAAVKKGHSAKGTPFKKNTIYDYVRILKPFTLWMIDNGHSDLPEKKVRELKVPTRDPMTKVASDLLTIDEINTMVAACRRNQDRALIMMLYEGGFRIGEIGLMKWSDLVFDNKGVIVNVSFKTERPRFIRLVMSKQYLSQWKADYPADPDIPGMLVFLNERNKPFIHRAIFAQLQRIGVRAGITKHITPHIFRHSRITHLIREGMPESVIKKMMWGNINTDQFQTYAHLTGQDVDDAVLTYYGISDDTKEAKKLRKMEPVQCPACKHINAPRSDFCSGCGNRFTDKAVTEMSVVQNTVISNETDFKAYIDRLVDEKIAKSKAG